MEKLLKGTHFTVLPKGAIFALMQSENGKINEVTDGTREQIIEFLEAWHFIHDQFKAQGTFLLSPVNHDAH